MSSTTLPDPAPAPLDRDTLLARHRKELRDLQALITQKKKAASKKTRKAVNAECERLEADLKARHHRELNPDDAEPEIGYIPPPSPSPEPEQQQPELFPGAAAKLVPKDADPAPEQPKKKKNRAKERLARRAEAMAAAAAEAEAEAAAQPDRREMELAKMETLRNLHGLVEHSIVPDGHCLYNAFAVVVGEPGGYKETRRRCAEYIREHPDDFSPFLEETVEERAHKVGETAEWGGHLEVSALASAYGVKVKVLQGEGRVEEMGEGEKEVWLGYYRHSYGLGEHYNALEKKA